MEERINTTEENSIKWQVYEEGVQSYRSSMISSQSFLMAIGAVLTDKPFLELLCFGVAMLQLWYIWNRVIISREIIVDYYKFNIGELFDDLGNKIELGGEGHNKNIEEKQYVQLKTIREKINLSLFGDKHGNIRATRKKIDIIMPVTFTFLWIVFVIYSFYEAYFYIL